MDSVNKTQLQKLYNIEEELANSLTSAGLVLKELSKDKINHKTVEGLAHQFSSQLERAGNDLAQQLAHLARVTTAHCPEGSAYSHKKDIQMAKSRLEHARNGLQKFESALNKKAD